MRWPQLQEHFEVPVAEGDVITASILVDGITTNVIDETVDCVPEPPTATTTTSTLAVGLALGVASRRLRARFGA